MHLPKTSKRKKKERQQPLPPFFFKRSLKGCRTDERTGLMCNDAKSHGRKSEKTPVHSVEKKSKIETWESEFDLVCPKKNFPPKYLLFIWERMSRGKRTRFVCERVFSTSPFLFFISFSSIIATQIEQWAFAIGPIWRVMVFVCDKQTPKEGSNHRCATDGKFRRGWRICFRRSQSLLQRLPQSQRLTNSLLPHHYGPEQKKTRKKGHLFINFPISVRCKRMSEPSSEWPSTAVWILVYSGPHTVVWNKQE